MTITLNQVKKLREQTKAGVMDCRKALKETQGDLNKAKKFLEKKGTLKALKKKDRKTNAGIIESYIHNNGQTGAIVKLTCETDFVCKTKEFKHLAHELGMQITAMKPKNIKELLEQEYIRDPKKKIKSIVEEVIAKVGENIKVEEIARMKM